MLRFLVLVVLASGCSPSPSDEAPEVGELYRPPGHRDPGLVSSPDPEGEHPGGPCAGENAPVLGPLHTETEYHLSGGAGEPIVESLRFSVLATVGDFEGDLHRLRLLGRIEPADDGTVEPGSLVDLGQVESGEPCTVKDTVVGMAWIGLPELPLEYMTDYDVGFRVIDASGNQSALLAGTITTPGPHGEPPGEP